MSMVEFENRMRDVWHVPVKPPVEPRHLQVCGRCHGAGIIQAPHPMYGSRNCPEPIVERDCPDCFGEGAW